MLDFIKDVAVAITASAVFVADNIFYGEENGEWYPTHSHLNMAHYLGIRWAYIREGCLRKFVGMPVSANITAGMESWRILFAVFGKSLPKLLTYGKRLMARYLKIVAVDGEAHLHYREQPGYDGVMYAHPGWMSNELGSLCPIQVTIVAKGLFCKGMIAAAPKGMKVPYGVVINQDAMKVGDRTSLDQDVALGILAYGTLQRHKLSFEQMMLLNDVSIVEKVMMLKLDRLHKAVMSRDFLDVVYPPISDKDREEGKEEMTGRLLLELDPILIMHDTVRDLVIEAIRSQVEDLQAPLRVPAPIVLPDNRVPKGSISLWNKAKIWVDGSSIYVSRTPCIDKQGFSKMHAIIREDNHHVVYINPDDMPTFKCDFDGDRLLLITSHFVEELCSGLKDIEWLADEPEMKSVVFGDHFKDAMSLKEGIIDFIESKEDYVGLLTDMLTKCVQDKGEDMYFDEDGQSLYPRSNEEDRKQVVYKLGLEEISTALQCAVDSFKKTASPQTKCGETTWGEITTLLEKIQYLLEIREAPDVFPVRRSMIGKIRRGFPYMDDDTMKLYNSTLYGVDRLAYIAGQKGREIERSLPRSISTSQFIGYLGPSVKPRKWAYEAMREAKALITPLPPRLSPVWDAWRETLQDTGRKLSQEELSYLWDSAHKSGGKSSTAIQLLLGYMRENTPRVYGLSPVTCRVRLEPTWSGLPAGTNVRIKKDGTFSWHGKVNEIFGDCYTKVEAGYYEIKGCSRESTYVCQLTLKKNK